MKRILVIGTILMMLFLNIIPASADAAIWDEEPADYYVYVATPDGGLNIRSGPGTEYEKVMSGSIPDGVKLHIRAKSGDWGYTTYKGNYGWVALKQTTVASGNRKESADYYVYVATPDGGLNIRSGPGTEYDKVMSGRIPDGVKLYISEKSGDWGHTSYNGIEGWIALKQTSRTPPTTQETTQMNPSLQTAETEESNADDKDKEVVVSEDTIETQQASEQDSAEKNPVIGKYLLIGAIILVVAMISVILIMIINKK